MDAFFTRTDTPEGARFVVTPAPWPGVGCFGMPMLVGVGFVMVMTLTNVLLLITWPILLFLLWFSWKSVKAGKDQAAKRKPVTITVGREGIRTPDRLLPADDVVELTWNEAGGSGPEREFVYSNSDSSARAEAYGRNLGLKLKHVSWVVAARLKSDSRGVVVAEGLTPDTARSLAQDMMRAMRG